MEWVGQFESFVGVNPWTALFILLNTLTIYFVAKKFLFGPVMKIIAKHPANNHAERSNIHQVR